MNSKQSLVLSLVCWCLFCVSASGQNEFQVDRATIESWIFQRQNGSDEARKSLVAQVDLKISSIASDIELNDQQKELLKLAGEGDIKRFYDSVFDVIRKVEDLEMNQNAINDAYQMTVPLQQKLAGGLFGEASLLHKVLRGSLTPDQLTAIDHAEKRRREQVVSTLVRGYLVNMDQMIPMTASQLEQLTTLLIERTAKDNLAGEYGIYVVGYRLSKIDDKQIAEILEPQQAKALRVVTNQMRGIEAFLKQQGFIVEDDQPRAENPGND